ncbi:MAG: hypothetical protein GF317_10120 [Candidatus Lokiarchaeota archaeon]|nr:hypothetical protein [Candidatus Lokiarchaeota archaeon]
MYLLLYFYFGENGKLYHEFVSIFNDDDELMVYVINEELFKNWYDVDTIGELIESDDWGFTDFYFSYKISTDKRYNFDEEFLKDLKIY